MWMLAHLVDYHMQGKRRISLLYYIDFMLRARWKADPRPTETLFPILLLESVVNFSGRDVFSQGGSNMTGTDLCVNKPHCAAAVRS